MPAKPRRMPSNAELAAALDELGDLYELDGAIVHRVVAYRSAARAVRDAGVSVAELAAQGRAAELKGIGKTLQEKLATYVETGEIPAAAKLKERFPAGLIQVTRIPGLGPKRARKLFDELGVKSLDDLRQAAEAQQIRGIAGFGAKGEENILEALEAGADGKPRYRMLLSRALGVGEGVVSALRDHPASERVELAGSARRWADTCKDLDIVATATEPLALAQAFADLSLVADAGTPSAAGARGLTHNGVPVDLKIVAPDAFGNLLQHFTGSKAHNEQLRAEAVRRGLHVSEYGILDDATGETTKCATEEEVYERLGMAYVEPELREGRGELEAARAGRLPDLVTRDDIRGELHCHTTTSDGRNSIEQMAQAAQELGYEYLAITDHSATHGFGNDVQPDALRRQIERVRELDAALGDGFRLLAGSEVNILPDGTLDYDDDLLAELDWIVGSAHTAFRIGRKEMTKRLVAAIEHPLVDAIGHPTGRLIDRREPYEVDVERLAEAARENATFLEINANPDRRDLNEVNARLAAEAGVVLVIDSDAHGVETLVNMRYGVATARRAWLTAADIANTRPWAELLKLRGRPASGR